MSVDQVIDQTAQTRWCCRGVQKLPVSEYALHGVMTVLCKLSQLT